MEGGPLAMSQKERVRLVMNDGGLQTVEQARRFLEGSEEAELRGRKVRDKHCRVGELLIGFRHQL